MRGIHQTVEEIVARRTVAHLLVKKFLQPCGLYLRCGGGKHDAFAFLDTHLKIAGHIEILVRCIAALLLLGILYAAIPVGHEDKLVFL